MKHIVWTRIDDRLIHGQVMTQWIQYTEANEVLTVSYTHLIPASLLNIQNVQPMPMFGSVRIRKR